jgi:hypothetical protein
MVPVGPAIIVVKEAEVLGVCLRSAEVARVGAPMPFGPWDEGEGTYAVWINGTKDGVVFGLMFGSGAIVDDDDLHVRPGLSVDRFECPAEQGRAITGCDYDREERHWLPLSGASQRFSVKPVCGKIMCVSAGAKIPQ